MRLFKYIKIVRPYFKDNYSILIGSALFGVVLAGLKALQAYIVKPIFDQGLSSQSSADGVYYTSSILFLIMIIFMKRNFNILLLAVFVAIASCSFTTKTFENPNKDKLLMQLITYLLEQGHFQPKDFNDEFSADVFKRFLNRVDPYKHYFYKLNLYVFQS